MLERLDRRGDRAGQALGQRALRTPPVGLDAVDGFAAEAAKVVASQIAPVSSPARTTSRAS